MKTLSQIIEGQREFQKLCEINLDTIVAKEINELSERYLFKAIEEIIELRKTFPSELNQWAKNQPEENRQETLYELSDALFFILNTCLVRKIAPIEVLDALAAVQEINFNKLKLKKLAILKDEMARVPHNRIGFGGGELMPQVIIIGLSPTEILESDQNSWDNYIKDSAVGFLRRALKLGVNRLNLSEDDIYFTNIVKEIPENGEKPSTTMYHFWYPFLLREVEIVSAGTTPLILTMGSEATKVVMQRGDIKANSIMHPSYYMRNGFTEAQYYKEELLPKLKQFDLEVENGRQD